MSDLREGLRRWRSWSYLAVENVKNRYRRTVLGPWWLTLQMVIFIVGISIVFGNLLNNDLRTFLPYVALGFIAFTVLSGLTRAGADVFITGSSTLKSTRQPLSNLVLRDVGIEFINFAHNMVIYLVFLAVGLVSPSPKILIALPIVVVIAVNGLFVGLWLGIAVARFRDVQPFINSILGVAVFFSPVFYTLDKVSSGIRNALLVWNPFTYPIMAFRAPLLGEPLLPSYYVGTAIVTVINVALGLAVFTRARSRT
jgi:lipopolysaccharide transport system permease protein